jgi:flagellar motor switch protein FliN
MEENKSENNMQRLMDVEMNVTVRFGRTEMPLREIVRFGVGSMIELNRTVDEPVELLVNNTPFARGEVVVIDGYYGVRVTDIGTMEERSRTLMSESENVEGA